jgi:hypothetical protein
MCLIAIGYKTDRQTDKQNDVVDDVYFKVKPTNSNIAVCYCGLPDVESRLLLLQETAFQVMAEYAVCTDAAQNSLMSSKRLILQVIKHN